MDPEEHTLRTWVMRLRAWLLGITVVGVLIGGMGLGVFLGWFSMDPTEYNVIEHSFFNLTYPVWVAFSSYFILGTVFLILPTLDRADRERLHRLHGLFLFFSSLGMEILVYSLLRQIFPTIPVLLGWHSSSDYTVWGAFILVSSYPFIVFKAETFQPSKNYLQVFLALIILGFAFLGWSWIEYFAPLSQWWLFFTFGCLFLYLGGLPLSIVYVAESKNFFDRFRLLFLLLIGVGGIIYLTPTLIHNGILPKNIFLVFPYFELLIFGGIPLVIGSVLIVITLVRSKILSQLRRIWVVFLSVGVVQILIAILLAASTRLLNTQALFPQAALFYMTWDVWLSNGVMATILGLIFISPILFLQTQTLDLQEFKEETEEVETTLESEEPETPPPPSKTKKKRKKKEIRKTKGKRKRQRAPGS